MSPQRLPVVWVLVQDLGRTGVPISLDRLVRATPAASEAVHVVAVRGGPLAGSLRRSSASVTVLEPTQRRSVGDAAAVGLAVLGHGARGAALRRRSWRRRTRPLPAPDVVVVHGAGAWQALSAVPGSPALVLHLHELGLALDRCIEPADQASALRRAHRVLAVSRPVADLAVARGARSSSVELLPGVVESNRSAGARPSTGSADANLGVPDRLGRPGAVMGAGTPGWRKGTDRLAAVAYELARAGRAEQVVWVGGRPTGVDRQWVEAPDPVHWIAECPDPWAYMAHAGVVVVPSREDPLPLVALEAGLHERAVVAMPTGGLPDLLGQARGVVVPTPNVEVFAGAVRGVLDDPARALELGVALRRHVVAVHDVAVVAPVWWDLVRSTAC